MCSGAVYFQIPGNDIASIQSKISIIFLSIAFGGVIAFQTPLPCVTPGRPAQPRPGGPWPSVQLRGLTWRHCVPLSFSPPLLPHCPSLRSHRSVLERERPMVYRERASRMYHSVVYALSFALVEAPWIAWIACTFIGILYPMVGLRSDFGVGMAYVLVFWQVALFFNLLGMVRRCGVWRTPHVAAFVPLLTPHLFCHPFSSQSSPFPHQHLQLFAFGFPSIQVAQATGGIIVSAWFLLAGLVRLHRALRYSLYGAQRRAPHSDLPSCLNGLLATSVHRPSPPPPFPSRPHSLAVCARAEHPARMGVVLQV